MGARRVARVSVTMPEGLLLELDKLVERSFKSRSKAISEAVRMYIATFGGDLSGTMVGVVTYRFEGHRAAEKLREVGHKYLDVIVSTLHVHVSEDECVETLVVRGDGARVAQLVEELGRVKGVKSIHRTLASVTPGQL